MIKKFKYQHLISNFSYMFVIEMANYIFPFLVIPYIVQTVGVTNFGLITFSYVLVSYFNLFINYGFHMLIVKDISLHQHSQKRLNFLFSKMYTSQLILLIISIIIFIGLIQIPSFLENKTIFIYAFGMVIGNFLFPVWFFQGIEKMKFIALFNFFSRLLYLVLILTFIKTQDDYSFVILINSFSVLVTGILSLVYVLLKYQVKFTFIKITQIRRFFKDAWSLFISFITVHFYSSFNIMVLGLFAGYTAVGVYSLADKIFGALSKLMSILNLVIFPLLAKLSKKRKVLIFKIRQLIVVYIIALSLLSVLLFISSEMLISILYGENNETAIYILKVFSFVLLVYPLGQIFSSYMVIKNESYKIQKITLHTMITNMLVVFPLIYFYQEVGLVFAVLITQYAQIYFNITQNKELIRNGEKYEQ